MFRRRKSMPHWTGLDLHVRQPVCGARGSDDGGLSCAYTARRLGGADGSGVSSARGRSYGGVCRRPGIGLSATVRLIGLLHDLGKCTQEFADYLAYCRQHPDDHSRRGTVDHASAGGQLLLRRYGAHSEEGQLAADMMALVIFSHHADLMNYVDREGHADFWRRVAKKDVLAQVDLAYYYRAVIDEAKLDRLFEAAADGFSALDEWIASRRHGSAVLRFYHHVCRRYEAVQDRFCQIADGCAVE